MTEDLEIISMLEASAQHFIDDCQNNNTATDYTSLLAKIAELGLTGLALPETHGGSGLGLAAICALSRVFGQAALTTPFIGQCVLPSLILAKTDVNNSQVASLCEQLNSASASLAFAWQEQANQHCGLNCDTQFNDDQLSGSKRFVAGAIAADHLLVSAARNDTLHILCVPATA